jgi:hypothetical protein
MAGNKVSEFTKNYPITKALPRLIETPLNKRLQKFLKLL